MCSCMTVADGRSPDLRVIILRRLPGFPVAFMALDSPLTVAGAVTALEEDPHRVPF